jgi:hypothetical protein
MPPNTPADFTCDKRREITGNVPGKFLRKSLFILLIANSVFVDVSSLALRY